MCSLVEILLKVGHAELEEIQRVWKKEGTLLHVSSSIIYDEGSDCESDESDTYSDVSLVHDGLRDHQERSFPMTLASCAQLQQRLAWGRDSFITLEVTLGKTFPLEAKAARRP